MMKQWYASPLAEDPDVQSTASLFRIFSNNIALRIALELRSGEMSISGLSKNMRMRPKSLFRNLLMLVQRGVIHAGRHGNKILYGLEHPEIVRALDLLRPIAERQLNRNRIALKRNAQLTRCHE